MILQCDCYAAFCGPSVMLSVGLLFGLLASISVPSVGPSVGYFVGLLWAICGSSDTYSPTSGTICLTLVGHLVPPNLWD